MSTCPRCQDNRAAERRQRGWARLVFTPHFTPMTRGVLATIYCRGRATTEQCLEAARRFYAERAFVRVIDKPLQTKWATGSNLAFVSYAADPERNLMFALGVVDNTGKGTAGQAVQNANLMCGLPETSGLGGLPSGHDEGRLSGNIGRKPDESDTIQVCQPPPRQIGLTAPGSTVTPIRSASSIASSPHCPQPCWTHQPCSAGCLRPGGAP
jgi:hypothetical protein